MASFTTSFLGCKVSQTDAHAVRERLLADGHSPIGELVRVGGAAVTEEGILAA